MAAASLDSILLGVVGAVLGLAFGEQFTRMGPWALLVGGSVALSYLVPLNSRLGNGNTIGKRALNIRVVRGEGQLISPARSLLRSVILLVPFYINGALTGKLVLHPWWMLFSSLVVFGLGGGIIYLLIFNRRTRQSLHDLLAGTCVVRAGEEEGVLPHMWKGHYVTVAIIFFVAAIVPLAGNRFLRSGGLAELLPAYRQMLDEPEVANAQLVQGTSYFWDKDGKRATSFVTATVQLNRRMAEKEPEAKKFAQIILDKYPAAEQRDVINIVLVEGWSIGIASSSRSQAFPLSPLQWRVQNGATGRQ